MSIIAITNYIGIACKSSHFSLNLAKTHTIQTYLRQRIGSGRVEATREEGNAKIEEAEEDVGNKEEKFREHECYPRGTSDRVIKYYRRRLLRNLQKERESEVSTCLSRLPQHS